MSENIVAKWNIYNLSKIGPHTVEGIIKKKRMVFNIKSELIDGEYHLIFYTRNNENDNDFHAFRVHTGGNKKGDSIDWNDVVIPGRKNYYTSRKEIRKLEIIDSEFLNPRNHIY